MASNTDMYGVGGAPQTFDEENVAELSESEVEYFSDEELKRVNSKREEIIDKQAEHSSLREQCRGRCLN